MPVRLPRRPDADLHLVVVKWPGGEKPMMLLTTLNAVRTRKALWEVVQEYVTRWLFVRHGRWRGWSCPSEECGDLQMEFEVLSGRFRVDGGENPGSQPLGARENCERLSRGSVAFLKGGDIPASLRLTIFRGI